MKLTVADLGLISARERRALRFGICTVRDAGTCRLVARESGHTWIAEAPDEDAAARLLAARLGLRLDVLGDGDGPKEQAQSTLRDASAQRRDGHRD